MAKKEINEILKEQFTIAKQHVEEYKESLSKAKKYLLKNHMITDVEFTDIVMNCK